MQSHGNQTPQILKPWLTEPQSDFISWCASFENKILPSPLCMGESSFVMIRIMTSLARTDDLFVSHDLLSITIISLKNMIQKWRKNHAFDTAALMNMKEASIHDMAIAEVSFVFIDKAIMKTKDPRAMIRLYYNIGLQSCLVQAGGNALILRNIASQMLAAIPTATLCATSFPVTFSHDTKGGL